MSNYGLSSLVARAPLCPRRALASQLSALPVATQVPILKTIRRYSATLLDYFVYSSACHFALDFIRWP